VVHVSDHDPQCYFDAALLDKRSRRRYPSAAVCPGHTTQLSPRAYLYDHVLSDAV